MSVQQSLLKATLSATEAASAITSEIEDNTISEDKKLKAKNDLLKEYEGIEKEFADARSKNYDFKYIGSQLADKKARVILNMQRQANRKVMDSLKYRLNIVKKRIELTKRK